MPARDTYKPGDAAPAVVDLLQSRLAVLVNRCGGIVPDLDQYVTAVHPVLLIPGLTNPANTVNELFGRAVDLFHTSGWVPEKRWFDYYMQIESAMLKAMVESPSAAVNNMTNQQVGAQLDIELGNRLRPLLPAQPDEQYLHAPLPVDPNAAVIARPGSINALAELYLDTHHQNPTFNAALDGKGRGQLIDGLARMPEVQAALAGKLGNVDQQTAQELRHWFDPSAMSIEDSDEGEKDVDNTDSKLLTRKDRPKTAKRIADSFAQIASIVQLDLLRRIPMPVFLVAKSKSAKDKNVRAGTESQGARITIDQNDDLSVHVHEFGHVVENYGPLGMWVDIQWLLHARNTSPTLIEIPYHDGEPCYQADMPAYPGYSAKVYGGWGATEVVSTTMEMLSKKETAKTLIQRDPQVAAIVLRWLAPRSFITNVPSNLHAATLPSDFTF